MVAGVTEEGGHQGGGGSGHGRGFERRVLFFVCVRIFFGGACKNQKWKTLHCLNSAGLDLSLCECSHSHRPHFLPRGSSLLSFQFMTEDDRRL